MQMRTRETHSYRIQLFSPAAQATQKIWGRRPICALRSANAPRWSLRRPPWPLTHLALVSLKSAHVTREQYTGIWLPEPILPHSPWRILSN